VAAPIDTPIDTPIYTVGHSTRSLDELTSVLRAWHIGTLVDIRTIPRSRTNPQFNADTLPAALAPAGVRYHGLPGLGGLRRKKKGAASDNVGWTVDAFRNFADYAQTEPFARALDELLGLAAESTCAIMCAEAVWWRCHRRIVTDYLLARGVPVRHILSPAKAEDASMTPFARHKADGTLRYPEG
jgi:uncharacterized protein (DUF488 family)